MYTQKKNTIINTHKSIPGVKKFNKRHCVLMDLVDLVYHGIEMSIN